MVKRDEVKIKYDKNIFERRNEWKKEEMDREGKRNRKKKMVDKNIGEGKRTKRKGKTKTNSKIKNFIFWMQWPLKEK